jgi:hypothetical protein
VARAAQFAASGFGALGDWLSLSSVTGWMPLCGCCCSFPRRSADLLPWLFPKRAPAALAVRVRVPQRLCLKHQGTRGDKVIVPDLAANSVRVPKGESNYHLYPAILNEIAGGTISKIAIEIQCSVGDKWDQATP